MCLKSFKLGFFSNSFYENGKVSSYYDSSNISKNMTKKLGYSERPKIVNALQGKGIRRIVCVINITVSIENPLVARSLLRMLQSFAVYVNQRCDRRGNLMYTIWLPNVDDVYLRNISKWHACSQSCHVYNAKRLYMYRVTFFQHSFHTREQVCRTSFNLKLSI